VLDPRVTYGARSPNGTFDGDTLRTGTRKLGFYPDISLLQPGDLILVSPIEPDRLAPFVFRTHRRANLSAIDASFTHAAVYEGNHMIWEATLRKGVVHRPLSLHVNEKNCLKFVRDCGLTMHEQAALLEEIRALHGHDYDLQLAFDEALKDKRARLKELPSAKRWRKICVYAECSAIMCLIGFLWIARKPARVLGTLREKVLRPKKPKAPKRGRGSFSCARVYVHGWETATNIPLLPQTGDVSIGPGHLSQMASGAQSRFKEVHVPWLYVGDSCPVFDVRQRG
jgi:23S rRNA maturation mini-RNase III